MKHLLPTLAALAAGALLVAPAAEARQPVKLSKGATTLTLDAGLASALQTAGVAVAPRGPATAPQAGTLRFRLTSARLSRTAEGTLKHAGGFELARGDTRVVVHGLRVRLDGAGSTLTAKAGGTRLVLATLDVPGATATSEGRAFTLTGVAAALTAAGAGVLNEAFGTTLAEGAALGTLDVAARLRGKAPKAAQAADRAEARRGRGPRGGDDRPRGRGDAEADDDHGRGNDAEDGDDRGRGRDRADD